MPVQAGTASTVRFSTAASRACNLAPATGGRIQGVGTTSRANLDDGSANIVTATLYDASSGAATGQTASGVRPLAFAFDNLGDGDYYVELSDDNGAAPVQSPVLNVACYVAPCDLAFDPAAQVVEPNTVAGATFGTGPGYGLGTGAITVQATSSAQPVGYSLTGIGYEYPAVPGDPIRLGLSAQGSPFIGLAAATYDVYAKDSAGCVVRTTVVVPDDIPCDVSVEVETIEDTAFIRNVGGNRLEYDWNDGRGFGDYRFRSGLAPRVYQVTAREVDNPTCSQTVDYEIIPYPSPRLCCLYFLTIGGEWYRIEEPQQLDAQELVIKRDQKLHGVSFEYGDQSLGFDCDAGFDLIDAQYSQYGPDVVIGFIELKRDPLRPPALGVVYAGKLNLYDCDRTLDLFSCNVEGTGLATLLAARLKTSLDLLGAVDLDGNALTPVSPPTSRTRLHSKAIMKVGHHTADGAFASTGEIDRGTGKNLQVLTFGWNVPVVEDLTDMFSQNTGFLVSTSSIGATQQPTYPFHVPTEDGPLVIDFLVKGFVKIQHNSGAAFNGSFKLYYRVNNDPAELLLDWYGPSTAAASFHTGQFNGGLGLNFRASRSYNAHIGDEFYLYAVVNVIGNNGNDVYSWDFQAALDTDSFVKVEAQTIAPDNIANALQVYEALDRGLQVALGRPGLLRSTFFGRPDSSPRTYADLGEGARYVLLSGLMLRGIGGKPFAPSFQDILDGLDTPFCIGLSSEVDSDGADLVRIEKAEYFYQNILALKVDNCENFNRKIDPTRQANLVNIGFEKWQPEGRVENALDEPAARRQYSTPIRYNQVEYKRYSKFIAGGYLLEAQRRIGLSSNDGPNDNDTFIVAVVSAPEAIAVLGWQYQAEPNCIVITDWQQADAVRAGNKVTVLSGVNAGVYTIRFAVLDLGWPGFPANQAITALVVVEPLASNTATVSQVDASLSSALRAERTDGFLSVQNLYSPQTAYNLRLTPARMLRRHGRMVNSNTWFKQAVEVYRPTFAEGNQLLVTRLIGEAVALNEAATIQRQDLAPLAECVFIPEILTFDSFLDQAGFDGLRARRHGYIAVFDGREWFTGYILSVKWKRKPQTGKFELLRRAGDFDPATAALLLNEYNPTEYNFTEHN